MMEILVEMAMKKIMYASNFVPLMLLHGPYFSAEGALGLSKAKSW